MVKEIKILPDAWGDIVKISSYYGSISDNLSLKFERFLFEALENIQMFPVMYPIRYKNVRRKLLRKFPYAVYYYIDEYYIRLIAVMHQRENPASVKKQIRSRRR